MGTATDNLSLLLEAATDADIVAVLASRHRTESRPLKDGTVKLTIRLPASLTPTIPHKQTAYSRVPYGSDLPSRTQLPDFELAD